MRAVMIVLVAAAAVGGFCVGVANIFGMLRGESSTAHDAHLVRAPDGRCWRAHGEVEHDEGGALSWRTDSGPRVRVAGADWIEVTRGGGVGGQGLDWAGAAAVLGVDLGACLPAAECR